MERKNTLAQMQELFRDVLDNEEIELTDQTTAGDIQEWDSLSHIQLVVALEKHFKIKFSSREILSWKNVGELADTIHAKHIQ